MNPEEARRVAETLILLSFEQGERGDRYRGACEMAYALGMGSDPYDIAAQVERVLGSIIGRDRGLIGWTLFGPTNRSGYVSALADILAPPSDPGVPS